MSRTVLLPLTIAAAVLVAGPALAAAQAADPLAGSWRAPDGDAVISVAPCSDQSGLCATVIAESAARGESSNVGNVMVRAIRPDGRRGWKGRYVADGQDMGARIRLVSNDVAEFKVCAAPLLCETERYNRTEQ